MRRLRPLLFLVLLACGISLAATPGMWLPRQLPEIASDLREAGLQLDPQQLADLTGFPMGAIVSLKGCSGFHDACGSLVAPLEVSLLGDGVSGVVSLRAGESATLAEGAETLLVVRAEDMPVRNAECFTAPIDQPRLLESVWIAATAAP